MAQDSRIFVDSNYFIALANPSDALHRRACEIAAMLERAKPTLVISNFIFLEVVTILAQRGDRTIAIEGGKYLLSDPLMEHIHIDEWLENKSWEIFQEVKDKNVSFVDCSIVAVMQSEGISQLLTFDMTDFKRLKNKYRLRFL